eukprot:2299072-Pyramimonas_sp.AAC.1
MSTSSSPRHVRVLGCCSLLQSVEGGVEQVGVCGMGTQAVRVAARPPRGESDSCGRGPRGSPSIGTIERSRRPFIPPAPRDGPIRGTTLSKPEGNEQMSHGRGTEGRVVRGVSRPRPGLLPREASYVVVLTEVRLDEQLESLQGWTRLAARKHVK